MKLRWFVMVFGWMLIAKGCFPAELPNDTTQTTNQTAVSTASLMITPSQTDTATPAPTLTITPTPFLPATATITTTPTLTPDPNYSIIGPGPILCPILLYHHVMTVNGSGSQYAVTVDQFTAQMKWMKENGYQTIKVQDMVDAIHDGKMLPNKSFIITFDDGNVDIYNHAYPILRDLGFTATMYLIEDSIGDYGNFSIEIILELAEVGWEFGNHSSTHAYLPSSRNCEDEICFSRARLIESLNIPIDSFAYPFGTKHEESIQAVKDCRYTSGAGLGSWTIHTQERLFYFSRREVKGYFDMQRFITLVTDIR